MNALEPFADADAARGAAPTVCRGSKQPIVAIERGDAIRLRHGRIVEGRVDEVEQRVGRAGLGHDRLADVHDLRRVGSEAVDAEHLQRLAMKQDLEHAHRLAGDLGPGQVLEQGMADLVGNPGSAVSSRSVRPTELISGLVKMPVGISRTMVGSTLAPKIWQAA